MGPRAGLNVCEKSRPIGIRSPDRPARSQLLYRLSYAAHIIIVNILKIFRNLHHNLTIIFPQHTAHEVTAMMCPNRRPSRIPRLLSGTVILCFGQVVPPLT
jgi:hypothetical protein